MWRMMEKMSFIMNGSPPVIEKAAGAEIARLIDETEDLVGAHLAGRDVIAARYIAVRATKVAVVRDEYVHIGQATEVDRAAAAAIFRRQRPPSAGRSRFPSSASRKAMVSAKARSSAIPNRRDNPSAISATVFAPEQPRKIVAPPALVVTQWGLSPIHRQRHLLPDKIGESGRVIDPVACLIVGNRRRTNGRFLRGRLSLRKRFAQIAQQILHLGQDGRDV